MGKPVVAPDTEEETLARKMMDVHGNEAAGVARGNARGAALAGQYARAKSWVKVLGVIQQHSKSSSRLTRNRLSDNGLID
jgi:hypothetical protein